MAIKLKEAGLDPKYWMKHFKSIGATPATLKLCGQEHFDELSQFAKNRPSLEKKALKTFLGIMDENNAFRQKQLQQLEEKHKKCRELLQSMKKLQKEQKERHDEAVKKIESGICEMFNVSSEDWIPPNADLNTLLAELEAYEAKLSGTLAQRSDMNTVELIEHVSGGHMLRGIKLDGSESKNILLRAHECITFRGAKGKTKTEFKTFTSAHEEDYFTKNMHKFGIEGSPFVSAAFTVAAEVSARASYGYETQESHKHQQQSTYLSTLKTSILPLASCCFDDDDLILSEHALSALKNIEKIVLAKSPEIDICIACEDFFDKFGTYVNRGPYILGGIYWWKALSEGFDETKTDELKALHSVSLRGSGSLSYMLVGATNISYATGMFKGKNTEIQQKSAQVTNEQLGGPPEVTSLPQWKDGLIANNNTWNVIGQDTDLIYTWEILELNHNQDFEHVQRLSQLLSRSLERNQIWQNSGKSLLERVKIWNHSKDESKCIDHLSELVKEKTGSGIYSQNRWCEFYLKQLPIQYYLQWVVNIAKSKQCSSSEAIRSVMQQVLEYKELVQVLYFPDQKHICEWLYPVDQEVKLNIDATTCTDIPSFLSFLQKMIEQIQFNEVHGYQTQRSAMELLTSAVNCMQIQKQERKYDKLLLLALLLPLNYDGEQRYFRSELSIKHLEILHKKLKESLMVKHDNDLHAQAYLFLEVLNSGKDFEVAVSADDLSRHVIHLKHEIGCLEPSINDVLAKCQQQSQLNFRQLKISLKEMFHNHQNMTFEFSNNNLPEEEDDYVNEGSELVKSKYEQFLKYLSFFKYFPQKLTLQEALLIDGNGLASRSSTTDPRQLLPIILEKIKMSNYNCRKVLLYGKTSMLKEKEVDVLDDVSEDDYGDNSNISEDDDEVVLVHPMDSLLALIHCSDNFLRQDLYVKLNNSQLAVPLLLPDPVSETITFPLWALRSIVRSWKCKVPESQSYESVKSYKGRIVDCEAPIVSFIRFNHPSKNGSKSKILNKVISESDQFFFNHECEGSGANRKFVDGLVEATWYFPSGEGSDFYNDVISFLNLRGNAGEHKKQLAFLSVQSSLLFVFLNNEDVERYIDNIKCLESTKGKVVFLMTSCSGSNQRNLEKVLPECDIANILNKVQPDIVKYIRKKIIHQVLSNKNKFSAIQVDEYGIIIDENVSPCQQGKELASKIMRTIKQIPPSQVKNQVVPLQGSNLWCKWASLDKTQKRMKSEDMGHVGPETFSKLQREQKNHIRQNQLEKAKNPSPVMTMFINVLVQQDPKVRAYFLQWLKIYLDDRSYIVLAELQQECSSLHNKLRKKQVVADKNEEERIKKTLVKKHKDLIDASFGVEHLFRELGQIYECTMELGNEVEKDNVKMFPKIVAWLLLTGYPLEIVDGDTAYIQEMWIKSVLKKVKLLSKNLNFKIFALSVLGVQSAGKSTLLNTLFGVRFAVGGGRCTRGAYLQLMKLNSTASSEFKCDYMLIIDTEGLKALELDPQDTQQHDNELATLVIGLADMTIINIQGEVPADISEILQTSVHAFLRMKEVELKPSCQFVRHNVSNVFVSDSDVGSQRFQQILDDMTKYAAKAEHCEGKYTHFSDVINFNNETDVQNFPSFWKGNPPMAPVNPDYCEAAQKLKSKFIEMCKSPDSLCSIDEFETRVTKLWNAVLEENYVFSFKNMREVEAYALVDGEYGKWSWKIQNHMLVWENNAKEKLSSYTDDDVRNVEEKLLEDIYQTLDSEFDKIVQQDFKNFFENKYPSLAPIMSQWRAKFQRKLYDIKNDHKAKALKFCTDLIQNLHATKKLDELRRNVRKKINQHLKDLVSKMHIDKSRDLTEQELKEAENKFNQKWDTWMENEVRRNYPPLEEIDLESEIIQHMKNHCQLQKYEKLINSELLKLPLKDRGQPMQLIIHTRHLNCTGIFGNLGYTSKDLSDADGMTKKIVSEVKKYFDKGNVSYCDANAHVQRIIQHIKQQIDEHDETGEAKFKFTSAYRIEVFLEIAGYALGVFVKQQNDAIENHPLTYLKSLKSSYSMSFKALCTEKAREKASAICLVELVTKQLKLSLQERLVMSLADDVRLHNPVFASKQTLKGNILLGLLKGRDFKSYSTYLTNISQSYLQWIEGYIDEHCKSCSRRKLKIVELVEPLVGNVITAIVSAADHAYKSSTGITQWLTSFQTYLKEELVLAKEELHELIQLEEKCDLEFFTDEFIKEITKYKTKYLADFQKLEHGTMIDFITLVNKAAEIVHNSVAGCCEQCPFCKEQCEMTDSMHERDHVCTLHRPLCLGGYRDDTSEKMELNTCTQQVKSWKKFKNSNTNDKWVWYSKYREIYPR